MARDDAYRIVQRAAAAAWDEGASFRDEIAKDPEVIARLDAAAVDALFDPQRFLVNLGPVFDRLDGARGRHVVTLVAQGKVRDIFDAGDDRLLLVATDRISAFDVVLADADPRQGARADRVLAVLVRADWSRPRAEPPDQRRPRRVPAAVRRRRRAGRPGDARARGRRDPDGVRRPRLPRRQSGWTQYRERGLGVRHPRCPRVCSESAKLPEPIFTPTTKAAEGHDLPLTPDEARELVGDGLYERLRR